jgi:hypothetical protein
VSLTGLGIASEATATIAGPDSPTSINTRIAFYGATIAFNALAPLTLARNAWKIKGQISHSQVGAESRVTSVVGLLVETMILYIAIAAVSITSFVKELPAAALSGNMFQSIVVLCECPRATTPLMHLSSSWRLP